MQQPQPLRLRSAGVCGMERLRRFVLIHCLIMTIAPRPYVRQFPLPV
jgi:hypothetical protein